MGSRTPARGIDLLLVSGSLREGSTATAVLRTAVVVAPAGVGCRLYHGMAHLTAFNPDADRAPLPPDVEQLRRAIHRSDGVVFCTPEYAGALPGSFKNLLDWTIGDDHARSLYEKPVGWFNASPRGAAGAYVELRTVLEYAHARIVEDACVSVPVAHTMIDADGTVPDAPRVVITGALAALGRAVSDLERADETGFCITNLSPNPMTGEGPFGPLSPS